MIFKFANTEALWRSCNTMFSFLQSYNAFCEASSICQGLGILRMISPIIYFFDKRQLTIFGSGNPEFKTTRGLRRSVSGTSTNCASMRTGVQISGAHVKVMLAE